MKYFEEGILKYFKLSMKFLNISKWNISSCIPILDKFNCHVELLLPPKNKGYVFTTVCLSVYLFVCPLDYSKYYERISMKFLEKWGVAQGTID